MSARIRRRFHARPSKTAAAAAALLAFLCAASLLHGQVNTGELRLFVTDQQGAGVKTLAVISSEANQYRTKLSTDEGGRLTVARLPYGMYQIEIEEPGFARRANTVEIRSALPVECKIQLMIQPARELVHVEVNRPLINTEQAGAVNQIGKRGH